MSVDGLGRAGFAGVGAVLGVSIAVLGYGLLRPEVDSLWAFLMLRGVIGATVAAVVGPVLVRRKWW